ncbi:LysR family transcriptional regulator [Mangrovicoccus sp. HB161399]|uniref:LysR family transcriptional regulator n=1 Tax=Mangrovicoccus sp. HB161399 TaxID=2720392 RepID=UPI001C131DFF|nr:LysR family transcriptional regulator [Mangrovicoccus sp. HB161399]
MNDIAMANIRSLDLDLPATFDALCPERSVTRAAERLAPTQPAVSGMVKRLRAAFGDELFLRSAHGIVPTHEPLDLEPQVAQIVGAARTPGGGDLRSRQDAVHGPPLRQRVPARDAAGRLCGRHPGRGTAAKVLQADRPAEGAPEPEAGAESLLAHGGIDLPVGIGETAPPEYPALPLR